MTKQSTGSLWTHNGPDELIPETGVSERATELTLLVDEWINDHVKYIDPFQWEDSDEKWYRNKAILEVSGYLLNSRGVGGDEPPPELEDMVIDRVNDRRFAHRLMRSPRDLHHTAFPVLYVNHIDALEENTSAALERCVKLEAFWDAERLPMRQLEYCFLSKFFSQMFGYTQDRYNEKTILKNTLLNNQPSIIRSTLRDAYLLTHDVMFYNNHLGVLTEEFPDEPAPYDITELLQGLILRYMAEDNCDIVLELLLSGILQRQISRQMVQLVLSWVLEKADERGYVPGPTRREMDITNLPSTDKRGIEKYSQKDPRWDYGSDQEEIWGENFHVNVVAGMTARIIKRDWNKICKWPKDKRIGEQTFRRDTMRLGQLLKSLGEYDLKRGAKQMEELARSPVATEYQVIFQEAVCFLENQKTQDGEFGFWTDEEILYTLAGNSPESFRDKLVKPISESCREALTTVETNNDIAHADQL